MFNDPKRRKIMPIGRQSDTCSCPRAPAKLKLRGHTLRAIKGQLGRQVGKIFRSRGLVAAVILPKGSRSFSMIRYIDNLVALIREIEMEIYLIVRSGTLTR